LSILYKYNTTITLVRKYKAYSNTTYLQKYLKPYKNPVRIAFIYLAYYFINYDVMLKNPTKPISNVNLENMKYLHYNFLIDILIN